MLCEEKMKDFGIKLICILGASLALYFLTGIGAISVLARFRLADIQLIIPGAGILLFTVVSWIALLNRYAVCRRKAAVGVFLLAGLALTTLASIAYPVLKTGTLWQEPGKLGGAVLFIIIFYSLASQLPGFAVGFVPSALFIRRLSGLLNRNQRLESA